jgi:hypothetical protein
MGAPPPPSMKCTLCYLWGTLDYGHLLRRSAYSELTVYTDADAVFLSANLISQSSKRQNVISRSRAKAEYQAVANGVVKACRQQQLLQELHSPLMNSTLVYYDNVSAVYLSTNPIQQQRTKHVEIDLHFVRERVAIDVHVLHVPTTSQFTEIFTKGLPTSIFLEFWSSLNICSG